MDIGSSSWVRRDSLVLYLILKRGNLEFKAEKDNVWKQMLKYNARKALKCNEDYNVCFGRNKMICVSAGHWNNLFL